MGEGLEVLTSRRNSKTLYFSQFLESPHLGDQITGKHQLQLILLIHFCTHNVSKRFHGINPKIHALDDPVFVTRDVAHEGYR